MYYRTGSTIKQYVAIDDYFTSTSFYEDEADMKKDVEGVLLYVYQYETTGPTFIRQSGSALGASISDDGGTDQRLYMKNISEIDQYLDAGHGSNAFEEVIVTVSPNVVVYTSGHALDEYVYYETDGRVYKSLIASNSNTPSAFSSTWLEVPSFALETGYASAATDTAVISEDVEGGWLNMIQTNVADTFENQINEYEFKPEDSPEEFTSFSVKIVLMANTKNRIPKLSAFRAIAAF